MMTEEDSYDTTRIVTSKTTYDSAFESGDVKERLHMCEICGMRFGLLENLNRHRMIHTDQRPFPCTYCEKRFRLAQHLKEHIRIHTGEKPYKCPTCGRAFCQISNLKSHQKTHTKIKAFKCDICDKCFRRAFTLKQHKLTHAKRSINGSVRAASDKDVPRSIYHAFSGKQSDDPTRRIPSESTIHRRHFLNHAIPNMASDGRFIASSHTREFQVSATPSEISQTPVPPNSAPPRIAQVFVQSAGAVVLDNEVHPETQSEISQCPSLSALLRTDCDARMNSACSIKNMASSLSSNYSKPTGKSQSIIEIAEKSECTGGNQEQQERLEDVGKDCYGTSDFSCVQCNRCFSNQMELRNHAIEEHSRKNRRRDSAYSSHSDKSPTQSPSLATVSFRQAGDVPPLILSKSHFTEDSFMKRVKELALISLGRYSDRRQDQHTNQPILIEKERVVNNQRSELVKRERTISLEVGHSPTPTETIKETKAAEATRRDSDHRDDEIKIIRRGFRGSKKWKRELCKEWYEVPKRSNVKENSLKGNCETDEPQRKRLKDDLCDQSENKAHGGEIKDKATDANESSPKTDNKETSPSVSNFHRFAPIVEWKPVVTGWKDMICGTLYTLPPHAQHSYLQSMYDPRFMYSKSSSTESSDSHLATEEIPDNGTSPRYFRFSPHALANFPIDTEAASHTAGDSTLQGVYSYAHPTESMPLPGYSRLQHALLHYNWDPNRQRLGGTSSVPQTPNLISAT